MGQTRMIASETALMLVDGSWTECAGAATFGVENPATRLPLANVQRANKVDVNVAVAAAERAFGEWKNMTPRDRGDALAKIADEIDANADSIARVLATETGNAIRTKARPEVRGASQIFRYFAGVACEVKGETVPIGSTLLNYSVREPLGVVGVIIGWNAPVGSVAEKIAPALAAGNTVVLKAAEDAPLAVLKLARICAKHLPRGVLNVLTGLGQECGAAMIRHPGIKKLTFTDSIEMGKAVMREAATRGVPMTRRFRGKSPNIIFPDADKEWAVDGVLAAARITRQSLPCTAGTRILVHESIYDSFLEKLTLRLLDLKIGDPLDESTDVGAITSERQFRSVCNYVEKRLSTDKIELVAGGRPPKSGPLSLGYFIIPTIFSSFSNDRRLDQEDTYGPVLISIPWSDEKEVIKIANDTHGGQSTFVWTQNLGSALRTAKSLEAGYVQINQSEALVLGQSLDNAKENGLGYQCSLKSMLNDYAAQKNIFLNFKFS